MMSSCSTLGPLPREVLQGPDSKCSYCLDMWPPLWSGSSALLAFMRQPSQEAWEGCQDRCHFSAASWGSAG